ncbi:MAG: hypothetical protein NC311_05710 [Muribaculaceae bacterium]|nr:hypothetical protein [Muribaculaceae bacterium]
MKVNKKLMFSALGRTLFSLYTPTEIAKTVVDVINEEKPGVVELNTSRENGFVLRCKKDASLTDEYLYKVLADVTQELCDEKVDEVTDHMSDNFDMIYDSDYASKDYAKEIFEISHTGRLLYIEADI